MMIQSLFAWIAQSLDVARSRRQLAALDANALKDIGLTTADVEAECSRPFWDWHAGAGHPASHGRRCGEVYTHARHTRLMRH